MRRLQAFSRHIAISIAGYVLSRCFEQMLEIEKKVAAIRLHVVFLKGFKPSSKFITKSNFLKFEEENLGRKFVKSCVSNICRSIRKVSYFQIEIC
jgi:hypothetical protein